jgi:uncharacterized delta-60 repeat protein
MNLLSLFRRAAVALLHVGLILLLVPSVALAAAGDLDATFDGDGRVVTAFAGDATGIAVAVQADGKIVVAGRVAQKFALTRYTTSGALDPTFGGDGRVVTRFSTGTAFATGVAIQADGKIVAAGFRSSGTIEVEFKFALARYTPSGALDPTFGGDGRVTTGFATGFPGASANGVAIQADGKIVAIGTRFSTAVDDKFALARYNPSGALDPTFGGDGKVTTGFPGAGAGGGAHASEVAIQADGKIVAAGSLSPTTGGGLEFGSEFALARYDTSGALDPTFGGDGKVTTGFVTGGAFATDVAIQADGKIVAAGGRFSNEVKERFALARYDPSGALDPTFGGDGRVVTGFAGDAFASGVAIHTDGKIVAAGRLTPFRGDGSKFALARYNTSGAPDPTFGGDGKVTTGFDPRGASANGVAIQADGKIVVAGTHFPRKFALARYLAV